MGSEMCIRDSSRAVCRPHAFLLASNVNCGTESIKGMKKLVPRPFLTYISTRELCDVGCVHCGLWSYNEVGLTNHSAFLNVAFLKSSIMQRLMKSTFCSFVAKQFVSSETRNKCNVYRCVQRSCLFPFSVRKVVTRERNE